MNEYNKDIDLVIGCTYLFCLNRDSELTYKFKGIRNNRLVFFDSNGNLDTFTYNSRDTGYRYWKLIKMNFKFGRGEKTSF